MKPIFTCTPVLVCVYQIYLLKFTIAIRVTNGATFHMAATLRVMNLTKRFKNLTAVDNISFSAVQGEVVAFLGPNGAGKSTTMKMITGFLAPSSGTAYIDGYDILEQPLQAKRTFGYLPEGAPSYPDMTVKQFINFISDIRGIQPDLKAQKVNEVINKVKLQSVLHQRIETLSKGFKRRVGLAQALIHDPRVLILDEPTDGLDPNQKREVRKLITEMSKDKVIILSTHVLEEVEDLCDRVIVIAAGKILLDSTPQELSHKFPSKSTINILEEVFNDIAKAEHAVN